MNTGNNYFALPRFWMYLKMELFRSRKGILMTLVIIFGVQFFVGMLLAIAVEPGLLLFEHAGNYSFALGAGGFILSSLAFNDLGGTLKRYHYLTLPVSALEKFLCMWLLTSVGWILVFTLTYTVYALLANPVGQLLFRSVSFEVFDPTGPTAMTAMKTYFVLHGIFLAGAVHFKGYVFPKILFTLILFAVVCGGIFWLVLSDIFLSDHYCSGYDCELVDRIGLHTAWHVIKWLFWWVLAPLCWVITYLGLKEKEV